MAWFNKSGKSSDTVISSRVRLARNLAGYPFASVLDEKKAKEVAEKVSGAYEGEGLKKIDFADVSPAEAASYVEKHYVSREFAAEKRPHVLFLNEDEGTAIMVGEEDHVRIQSILSGLALDEAYKNACAYDDMLDREVEIAYDEKLGYLTHCPTNLGTGMRASVMMFLPALTMTGRINAVAEQLPKMGLTVRGMYGEGSESRGDLYQISNQITLGISEEDTLKKLGDIVGQISAEERKARSAIKGENYERLCDRIMRAEGTLRYAHMLSSGEFAELYAYIRLGISLGIVKDISYDTLDTLLVHVLPATLTLSLSDKPKTENERDRARAKYIKEILK